MATEGTAEKKSDAPAPDDPRKPDGPEDLRKPSWKHTAKTAANEFIRDQCTDLAAGLTYYSVLALFPALLAIFSLLGVVGRAEQTVSTVLELLGGFVPQDIVAQLEGPITNMAVAPGSGFALIIGIAVALWSASNYVNAFSRAMNRIYEVDEGRPLVKLRATMLMVTIVVVLTSALLLLGLVVSGPIAESISRMIGLGSSGLTVWNIAKWPVMLMIVVIMVALLYYFTPNVKQPKFRWVSVGSLVAIGVAIALSLVFGLYVANFANYNKTYGALGGVIIFLLWLWITNNALLFGAEIDSEMERARQLQAGIEAEETLQLPPRDTKQSEKAEQKREKLIEEGRSIRTESEQRGEAGFDDDDAEARDDTDADPSDKASGSDTDGPSTGSKPGRNRGDADDKLSDFARRRQAGQTDQN